MRHAQLKVRVPCLQGYHAACLLARKIALMLFQQAHGNGAAVCSMCSPSKAHAAQEHQYMIKMAPALHVLEEHCSGSPMLYAGSHASA